MLAQSVGCLPPVTRKPLLLLPHTRFVSQDVDPLIFRDTMKLA